VLRGLFDNLPLKLGSLLLAFLLWFVIAGEKTSEMGLSVPLELQNFPTDLEITGDPVNSVEVRIRASPGIIHNLGPGEVTAHLDLARATEGERIIHLTEECIRVPFGVRVVKVNPAILTLNLEKTIERTVPVRPRILGRPARGYEVGGVTSRPAEARMAGPRSRVQEVDSAFTEPVSVEGADSSIQKAAALGLEDSLLRIQGDPRVEVRVEIRAIQSIRVFDAVAVVVRGGQAQPQPATVRVTLHGPEMALQGVAPGAIRAYVDLAGAGFGRPTAVSISLDPGPPGVGVDSVDPAKVSLNPLRSPQ
jgi:YbbR domain-containing protein